MRWRLALVACAMSLGCRSLDGLTGGASTTGGGGGDGGPPPPPACVPSDTDGTVCVSVSIDPAATLPPYSAFSGSGTVGADGSGFVQLFLFDKDPTDPVNGHVLPKVTVRYPPDAGASVPIDALPVDVVGSAPPNAYWAFAFFADNDVDARGTGILSTLSGDFVTPEDIASKTTLYPIATLTAGAVVNLDIKMVPLRALSINTHASAGLLTQAQSTTSVHGDGPGGFFIYDGDLTMGAPTVVDFAQVNCMDLQLQNPSRPDPISVTVGTIAAGQHNVYANVFDYANPDVAATVLPPGSIESSASAPAMPNIDPTQWLISFDVTFIDVFEPVPSTQADPAKCN